MVPLETVKKEMEDLNLPLCQDDEDEQQVSTTGKQVCHWHVPIRTADLVEGFIGVVSVVQLCVGQPALDI